MPRMPPSSNVIFISHSDHEIEKNSQKGRKEVNKEEEIDEDEVQVG